MAIDTLRSNKLRSFLTIIGVVVGVITVMLISSIISGIQLAVEQQVKAFGTRSIFVYKMDVGIRFGRPSREERMRPNLTLDDALALRGLSELETAVPRLDVSSGRFGNATVVSAGGKQSTSINLMGTLPEIEAAGTEEIVDGRWFTQSENDNKKDVCVIGDFVRETFFPYRNPVGETIEFGKIVSIAIGMFTENEKGELGLKTKYFTSHDEKKLLIEFKQLLEKLGPAVRMCAHNGKEFDFPYMSRRMLINGITLPEALNLTGKKPWDILHLDTLELWKFGDYKHYTSLDLLAAIFNIPSSKGVMDGSQVNEVYYKEKDLAKISDYCVGDVIAVAQLYLRLKGLPLMPEQNIKHANEQEKI